MEKADIIFYNGTIYTQSCPEPAGLLAVGGKKLLYVGDDADCCGRYETADTRRIDLEGKTVLPGFIDSHTHPSCIALTKWRVLLPHTDDARELLDSAAAYCAAHPKEEVPFFHGEFFRLSMFDEKGPTKELLDSYIPDRPARLQDFTDHSCWYNSKALELMGIRADVPDSAIIKDGPGKIVRRADKEPTGWVLEIPDNKIEYPLYEAIGWHPPLAATEDMVQPFLRFLSRKGVTAVFDALTGSEDNMRLYYEMDKRGVLPMYYEGTVQLTSADSDSVARAVETARSWQEKYTGPHVHVRTIKIFLDGTNELGDSASLEPMRTDPDGKDYGEMNFSEDELYAILLALNEAGLDLHIHMVGDRAFRTACDALERARTHCGDAFRIRVTGAHCELVHPDDRRRPARLGMYLNWTPHWAGGYFGDAAAQYLGEERFAQMYDFREMLDSGANIAYSSDVFSYKEADRAAPFFGIQVGATRVDPQYPLNPDKYPGSVRKPADAKMDVGQLIYGYTLAGAKQMRLDSCMGSLEAGKLANFIILPRDPYRIPPEELQELEPEAVYFEGRRV